MGQLTSLNVYCNLIQKKNNFRLLLQEFLNILTHLATCIYNTMYVYSTVHTQYFTFLSHLWSWLISNSAFTTFTIYLRIFCAFFARLNRAIINAAHYSRGHICFTRLATLNAALAHFIATQAGVYLWQLTVFCFSFTPIKRTFSHCCCHGDHVHPHTFIHILTLIYVVLCALLCISPATMFHRHPWHKSTIIYK